MPTPTINWQAPDYLPIWHERARRLAELRKDPELLAACKIYYRTHVADFINDWGVTVDTRLVGKPGRSPIMPFVLMPKQREWVDWFYAHWIAGKDGATEKSRDCGLSWLSMGSAVTLCMFWDDLSIGFGSAKEDKVDRTGDPDCLFYKGRIFIQYLPKEFRGNWDLRKHSAHMRLQFPGTRASITGEAGDNIGRGGRKGIYVLDESAHIEHPKLIDASLLGNTDCRQDVSSVNGSANSFAERTHSGLVDVFTFHWTDDLRKGEAWGKEKKAKTDPVIWAQEYDLNYNASVEGIIIPQEWVLEAVDAHKKLGIVPTGEERAAFDVADEGIDKNAFASCHGVVLTGCQSWRGVGSDIFKSTQRVFLLCDEMKLQGFTYDADGLGAGVRGDAERINEQRVADKRKLLVVEPFRGSGGVMFPERFVPGTDRKNIDFFENFKAQSWWALRERFLATHRAVNGEAYDPSDIISISGTIKERAKLAMELSQPVWKPSKTGKWMVEKKPEGTASPNNADAVMMLFAPKRPEMKIDPALLETI
jgi:phage terminase large subunit